MLVFGRITYEGMAAYWLTADGDVAGMMNSLPKVVFSRTLRAADWANTTLIRDDAGPALLKLKRQGDGNMFVFGSGKLSATFIREGLFDEYRLLLAPIILGNGNSLARPTGRASSSGPKQSLGGVILRYAPK
jgi:dihydrofolate reductase